MARKALAVVLPLALAALACDRPRSAAESRTTHTFTSQPGKLLRIEPRSLDVAVTVADVSEITVGVRLEARASSAAHANRWIERNQPVVEDDGGKLSVTVPRHRETTMFVGWSHTKGTLTFTVPPSCRLEVETSSGDVTLDGDAVLTTEARIETRSGDIEVSGGVKELVVHTTSGDVEITDAVLALLDVQTTSGDVALRSGSSRTLIETASGEVRLEGATGDLSVSTSSGDVRASFETLAGGDSLCVSSSSGDITLVLPDVPLSGDARASSGRIRSRFDGTWDKRRRHLALHAAEGAVDLDVSTSSGEIVLSRSH